MKKLVIIALSIFTCSFIHAQSFQDNPTGENTGDFPSQWNLIKGSSEIAELNGQSVIYMGNKSIISPKISGTNYLENSFTLEFDAFYDADMKIPIHQYYEVRFWEGHSYKTLNDRKGFLNPLLVYCHGAKLEGRINGEKVKFDDFEESMKDPQNAWRHISINYNNGMLSVKVDDFQSINLPILELNPRMISIGAYSVDLSSNLYRAIKNVNISGINTAGNGNDTAGNSENTIQNSSGLNYTFPIEDGLPNQILQTDGQGTVSWVDDNPDIDFPTSGDQSTNYAYTLPQEDGLPNQILQTNGNGQLTWIDLPSITSNDSTATSSGNASGLEAIDEGNGIGWRLVGRDPDNFGNIGKDAVDFTNHLAGASNWGATGNNSFAIGHNAWASEWSSMAIGEGSVASAKNAYAIGYGSSASGVQSSAFGDGVEASGAQSSAFGITSKAKGTYSVAMGLGVTADSYGSTAVGIHNLGGGDPRSRKGIDPLFEIGNGTAGNKSNALTVLKNGNIGIGTHIPQVKLHITGGEDVELNKGGYLVIGDRQNRNLAFDANEIMARNNVQPAPLYLQQDGGDVYVGGAVVHSSDKRLKKNIGSLSYGLDEILQLKPKTYIWKDREQNSKSIGLIAQEVEPIIAELVSKNEKDGMLSVNYTELIPVLINAIKEQQTIIDYLKNKTAQYEASIKAQEQKYSELTKRVEQLETGNNQ